MLHVKALHIIAMVTWFAGIFYLPRLFVYHAMATDAVGIARFKVMERRLFWGIMTPGALVTLACGLWLLYGYGWAAWGGSAWLHAKLALVAATCGYHVWCGALVAAFARDANRHSHRWYRVFNEVPVVALVLIVWLVVAKP